MDNNQIYTKRYWALGFLIVAMLTVVVLFIILTRRDQNANLEILSVPDDASFTIDGKQYSAGKLTLLPGEYKIEGTRDGFEPISQTAVVGERLSQVAFAFSPVSEEAKKWANDNPGPYNEIESIGGQLAQQQGQEFRNKYPLTAKLPYNGALYSINYARNLNEEGKIYIRIDAKGALGRQAAIAQIREWNYNPTDYSIVFAGLLNPFDSSNDETPGE